MPQSGVAPRPGIPEHPGWPELLLAAAFVIAGWAFCFYMLLPGAASYDALYVYEDAYAGKYGDWQPPLFGVIWLWLEHLFGTGAVAINGPTLTFYWLAFFLLFLGLRRTGTRLAWLALLLPLAPPLLVLQGIVWRDVVFSTLWVLSAALVFAASDRPAPVRLAATVVALLLFVLGFWLRPNAIFAAVPLFAYIVWPQNFRWKRLFLSAVPVCLVLQGSASLINYSWLNAVERHPTHSIMVFDLAGISQFTGQNVFPVADWTPEQITKVTTQCYDPGYWDSVWWMRADCAFIMKRLDGDSPGSARIFGTPALTSAWIAAIEAHPLAYLQHRLAHFRMVMLARTMVMFDHTDDPTLRFAFTGNDTYKAFSTAMHWLQDNTPLFYGLPWLLLAGAVLLIGLVVQDGRAKAAILGLSMSGVIFTLTYLPFGVAAEYRYVYWTVFSGLVAGLIALAKWADNHTRHAGLRG